MNKNLSFTDEEVEILSEAFHIIDELVEEANAFGESTCTDSSSERLKYHLCNRTFTGEEIEICYNILSTFNIAIDYNIKFSIEED